MRRVTLTRPCTASAPSLPARWVEKAAKELKGKDVGILTRKTAENIKPLYMTKDLAMLQQHNMATSAGEDATALPGEYPFLRGPYDHVHTPPLDHPPVHQLLDCSGEQCILPRNLPPASRGLGGL